MNGPMDPPRTPYDVEDEYMPWRDDDDDESDIEEEDDEDYED
jgi:hypothetical protein